MASLEQIAEALKRAHAAGDTAGATKLASAYRSMSKQAPMAQPVAQQAAMAQPQQQGPNFLDATMATVNGLTSSVPFLQETSDAILAGGQSVGDMFTGQQPDFGRRYGDIRASRDRVAERAPVSNALGQIGGVLGTAGALGGTKLGAEALGMTGKFGKQLVNSALSTAGYEGVSGLSKGHTGGQLLGDMGLGFAGGGAGATIGRGIEKAGQSIADTLTRSAQNRVTNAAIERGTSTSKGLKQEARGYFGDSVDENPVMVTGDAYHRLLSNVQGATKRYRPNELNNPEAVGLLQKLWQVADEINAPGSNAVVDLKDLHILRMGARDVAEKAKDDDTKTIAKIVIRQLDDFIKGMGPDDIIGGADPTEAASNLMAGIQTWAKASKVKSIEDAIAAAETYKSGPENGLKLSFLKLMRSDEFQKMSKVEQDAIRQVAHGTTTQNIAEGLGKLGFSLGNGSAHNIVGGSLGTAGLSAFLTPALGPLALPAALGTTTAIGAAGRGVAEALGKSSAERAAQIAATPGIRQVAQKKNILAPVGRVADFLIRGSVGGGF